ncbi:Ldh family oxidoreductase [Neptuniibacter halophilus]|uniref:Ldh family oxidoreductase n=1 Tax=Neptuniibacter halophilus TaxID=651666 RepID=UPI0025747F36|nr:Ldh family oxidoreductase [Neptuniibacter halophilus]
MTTYRYEDLLAFATRLLEQTGLNRERAGVLAEVFLEADLLGFSTHGLNRIKSNIDWLLSGETRCDGEPEVLVDRGAVISWDGNNLPGPYLVRSALSLACERAKQFGQVSMVIRHAQHIACLAAYLLQAVEQGLVVQMICSSPGDRCVSPHGSHEPVFSPNPFAFAAPTKGLPILIDMSLSVVAEGKVAQAQRDGVLLDEAILKDAAGNPSRDPAAYWSDPKGAIMPLGGLGHGYKGYGLCLWSEVMTMALANYGRADNPDYSEENSVFIQVWDPAAFGSLEGFIRESEKLVSLCRRAEVAESDPPVRVPGEQAMQRRERQLQEGLTLKPAIIEDLIALADQLKVDHPFRAG